VSVAWHVMFWVMLPTALYLCVSAYDAQRRTDV
jgi:hypothetical protein